MNIFDADNSGIPPEALANASPSPDLSGVPPEAVLNAGPSVPPAGMDPQSVIKYLNAPPVADPFGNYDKNKDQSRVPHSQNNQMLQQLAGDVIPLPVQPSPNTGPTNQSSAYATGKATAHGIAPIPLTTLQDWMQRTMSRNRS